MLVNNKEQNTIQSIDQLPEILALNRNGEPLGWLTYRECVLQYAKENILYSLGEYEVIIRGGTNAKTGLQSTLKLDTIVAIDNDKSPFSYRRDVVALSNDTLFERDRNLCAYCGNVFKRKELTRDHVKARSQGGLDVWENVVAACKPCNSAKDSMTPQQAGMELLFLPYCPNYHEHLILRNRKILTDQMEFLMRGVHKNSRLRMDA